MNFIELFINEPADAKLDISNEIDIALQYSIADISDISKRNSAYSKTIILPGTKNNNYWFGNLFDVNADFTMFNPNKKTAAKLLVNTETVIDGFLQLRKIIKLNNVDNQGNLINYEVVIYNNSVDLMSVIGESPLSDLDLSEYGHTFSAPNIEASWSHTWQDGYVYPMLGLKTTPNQYKPEYFYPSIFYRTLLDKIVRSAGFGWTGSLAQNEQFNNEVILCVTDGRPKINEDEVRQRSFYVGLTPSQTVKYKLGPFPSFFGSNYVIPYAATGSSPAGIFQTTTGFTMSFGIESGLSPNGDGDFFDGDENNWNSSLFYWDVKKTGKFQVAYNLSYYFQIQNDTPGYNLTIFNGSTVSVDLSHLLQYKIDNASPWVNWDNATYRVDYTQSIPNGGTASKLVYVNRQTDTEIELPVGAKVRLIWKGRKDVNAYWATPGVAINTSAWIEHSNTNGGNWIRNIVAATEIGQNEYLDITRFLPDKIKQKDLILDLITRYNLYIQIDPNNPRQLIFDTRPDFYQRGIVVDWTSKKDYSSPDEIQLLSDLQSKLMIWSYKEDSDEYNDTYRNVTGDIYGQYKYYFDNDFVKGEDDIQSSFSPTPLIKTPFSAIVPGINPDKPKVNPRVLYWGGLRDCNIWSWSYLDPITGVTGPSVSFTTYPYAGHFDDPINPEIDINFGTNKYYYYDDWAYITDNNMFNTYWSDYVRQIESGRLITSFFYLDEYDIRFIKDNFYTKIFVLDSYYYVNKIIDYKPLLNGITKVELIKIIDGVKWEPKKTTKQISARPNTPLTLDDLVIAGNGNSGSGGVVVGSGNVSGGVSVKGDKISTFRYSVVGDNNINSGDTQLIIGSRNTITGDKSAIIGGDDNVVLNNKSAIIASDNNYISPESIGIVIGGNDNIITSTNSSILIGASGITASENQIYLGNNFIIDAISGSFSTPYFSGTGPTGPSGTSGTSGVNGTSGTSGQTGTSGTSGINGTSGTSGANGVNGTSGTSGANGTSGTSGQTGTSGTSGASQSYVYYTENTTTKLAEIKTPDATNTYIGELNIEPSIQSVGPGNTQGVFLRSATTALSGFLPSAYSEMALGLNNIYMSVISSTNSVPTWLNLERGIIYMTPDAGTTYISATPSYVRISPDGDATMLTLKPSGLNLQNIPSTASVSGDIWRDSNYFLRIVP